MAPTSLTKEFSMSLQSKITAVQNAPCDGETMQRIIGLIDSTDLNKDTRHAATPESTRKIEQLCANAQTAAGNTAAICIWPLYLETAVPLLQDTGIEIATVVNFPDGEDDPDKVAQETRDAIHKGATEIDVVIPWKSFLAGDKQKLVDTLTACKKNCGDAPMKVILESGVFGDDMDELKEAADLAITCGANMLKTSTGFFEKGADLKAAAIMLQSIKDSGKDIGLKISGGVRTPQEAAAYIALAENEMGAGWVTKKNFRFGASSLLGNTLAALGQTTSQKPQMSNGY